MDFFKQTKIAKWQGAEREKMALSIDRARTNKLSELDRHRLLPARRLDLLCVNRHSRVVWGQLLCDQFSKVFCDGGNGKKHNRKILFVTLCDEDCVRAPQKLSDDDFRRIKNRLRRGLCGLSYYAVIEPAYYTNFQAGIRYGERKRCVSWHLHALVWGISKLELNQRIKKLRKKRVVSTASRRSAAD